MCSLCCSSRTVGLIAYENNIRFVHTDQPRPHRFTRLTISPQVELTTIGTPRRVLQESRDTAKGYITVNFDIRLQTLRNIIYICHPFRDIRSRNVLGCYTDLWHHSRTNINMKTRKPGIEAVIRRHAICYNT